MGLHNWHNWIKKLKNKTTRYERWGSMWRRQLWGIDPIVTTRPFPCFSKLLFRKWPRCSDWHRNNLAISVLSKISFPKIAEVFRLGTITVSCGPLSWGTSQSALFAWPVAIWKILARSVAALYCTCHSKWVIIMLRWNTWQWQLGPSSDLHKSNFGNF